MTHRQKPTPYVNTNTGKLIDTEYRNGARARLVTVCGNVIITLGGGSGILAVVTSATTPVGAGIRQAAGITLGVLNEEKLFSLSGIIPPYHYYMLKNISTNATVTITYSWDETDI